jgi:hypothetical protein
MLINSVWAPIVHPRNWDLVRVPLHRTSYDYVVYVADGYHRRYDDHTLPDELKTKLAMILATDWDYCPDEGLLKLALYTNRHSPALDEIGWRASESYFCLVLTRSTLAAMKGESNG